MRTFLLLCLLTFIEGKRKRPTDNLNDPRAIQLRDNEHRRRQQVGMDSALPIVFTNLGKTGVMDPRLGIKQPIDFLELDLKYPRSPEEELRMLQKANPRNLIRISKTDKYVAPQYKSQPVRQYNPDVEEEQHEDELNYKEEIKIPKPFNLEAAQLLNSAIPQIYQEKVAKTDALYKTAPVGPEEQPYDKEPLKVEDMFASNSFDLRSNHRAPTDWTTCEDFARKAYFHPKEVAGVNWVPFFTWSPSSSPTAITYEFSYPTKKMVHEYRTTYEAHVNKTIDWKQPMLILRAWMEMLFIAGDRRGLFHVVLKEEIPDSIKNTTFQIPTVTIRMKIVNPYLGIMFCEEQIGLILAVEGQEPDFQDMAIEAKKLGFNGKGTIVLKNDEELPLLEDYKPERADDDNVEEPFIPPQRSRSPFFNHDPDFM